MRFRISLLWLVAMIVAVGLMAGVVNAQETLEPPLSYNGSIEENFDSITAVGTAMPAGWVAGSSNGGEEQEVPTSYYNDEVLTVTDGASTTKGIPFNVGTTSDSDRCVGGMPTSSAGDGGVQVALRNDTGAPLTSIEIRYTGEQWRERQASSSQEALNPDGSVNLTERLIMFISDEHDFSGYAERLPVEFDFNRLKNSGTDQALDGNLPENRTEDIGGIYTFVNPIPAGGNFYITWHDFESDATNDHLLCVDDVVIGTPNVLQIVAPIDWASVDVTLLEWFRPKPKFPADDHVTVDVYFGTDSDLQAIDRIETNQDIDSTGNFGKPLDLDTVYYWRVDVIDPNNGNPVTTKGNTWSFLAVDAGSDCNGNGIPDAYDIANGTSLDCNTNGIPDECDPDCNGNGVPDECDIAASTSQDMNTNGVPDECEADCNGNGIPDAHDIATGTSLDCNANGIPDECDILDGTSTDINDDTIPDECQPDIIIIPSVTLDNPALASDFRDSAPDSVTDLPPQAQTYYVEIWASDVGETNTGLTGAFVDIAFSEQSAVTTIDHGSTFTLFTDGGVQPGYVTDFGGGATSAGLGVEPEWVRLGWLEMTTVSEASTCTIELLPGYEVAAWDRGAIPWEFVQLGSITLLRDCNNNGVGDDEDITSGTSLDCNNNGIPDECDILDSTSLDCNNNGVPDECDITAGTSLDCNNNGIPDECDIAAGTSLDCNSNGIPDECDIDAGTSTDANTDGIPDDCQTDVRLAITAGTTDPVASSDIRTTLPPSITTAIRGSRYYLEIWATDLVDNDPNLGLGSVYADIAFDDGTSVTQLYHSIFFDELPQGAIQPNLVTDFGGTTSAQDVGIEPEWVRLGFIEMRADVEVPACTISLMPGTPNVTKQNGAAIAWEFVELDSVTLQITEPAKPYNLDGTGDIGLGDFSLFVPSWLQSVPPADIEDDFDCDCFVGVGDLSYFATAWRKSPDDPTIIYPPCPDPTCTSQSLSKASNLVSAWLSDADAPLPESQSYSADMSVEAAFELLVLETPSTFDAADILPASVETLTQDQTYYLEVWAQDVGNTNPGLTSAYVDLNYPADSASVVSISNKTFDIEPDGIDNGAGTIDELGGSILAEWIGTGEWVRVALVTMHADSPAPPLMIFSLSPSTTGVGSYGRGTIPWSDIYLPTVGVPPLNECDFTADGKVDIADFARLAARFEPDGDDFDDLRCIIENWLDGTTQ